MRKHEKNGMDTVSWHKQFWPWFLIILLSASVISSLLTVYYAVRDPDPIVDGNYYKHGLTINEQLNKIQQTPSKQSSTKEGERH